MLPFLLRPEPRRPRRVAYDITEVLTLKSLRDRVTMANHDLTVNGFKRL